MNWYPGHMNKAKKDIQHALNHIDVVIELLDARVPYSSRNPVLQDLIKTKPSLIVFNKIDLADQVQSKLWQIAFNQKEKKPILFLNSKEGLGLKELILSCQKLSTVKKGFKTHVMILGIPNVGKSSLINRLAKRKIAKVENRPAVTKSIQWVELDTHLVLMDTPGLLWPKINEKAVALNLAAVGCIKDDVLNLEEVAFHLMDILISHYPDSLKIRYDIPNASDLSLVIDAIAKKRGFVKKGGGFDYEKAIQLLLYEFRNQHLGPITLDRCNTSK